MIQLGFDECKAHNAVNTFKGTLGVLLLRQQNLPDEIMGLQRMTHILAVLSGDFPTYEALWDICGEDLHACGTHGVIVQPTLQDSLEECPHVLPPLRLPVLNTCIAADAKARGQMLMQQPGFNRLRICYQCRMECKLINGFHRPVGYTQPVPCGSSSAETRGYSFSMAKEKCVRKPRGGPPLKRRKTAAEIRQEADVAQQQRLEDMAEGRLTAQEPRSVVPGNVFYGLSPFFSHLPYMSMANAFTQPFAHAFLLGIFKNLWRDLLGKRKGFLAPSLQISPAKKKALSSRAAAVVLHPSFGSESRDIVQHLKTFKIEECARWLLNVLPLILPPLPDGEQIVEDPHIRKFIGLLLRLGEFHWSQNCFSSEEEFSAAVTQSAMQLLRLGKLLEQGFQPDKPATEQDCKLCTANMHFLSCSLPCQLMEMGHTAQFSELFVERGMQKAKHHAKNNPAEPAKTLVNELLHKHAKTALLLNGSDIGHVAWKEICRDLEESCDAARPLDLLGSCKNFDPFADPALLRRIKSLVRNHSDMDESCQQWHGLFMGESDLQEDEIFAETFARAVLECGHVCTSCAYGRGRIGK
eukprot:jgi/Botrbrau1/14335/Bobra.0222s0006.2